MRIIRRYPTIKEGDVVWSLKNTNPIEEAGLVVAISSEFTEDSCYIPEEKREYFIYWYSGKRKWHLSDDFMRCPGSRNKKNCVNCGLELTCPHLRIIVRCNISEFRKGKIDANVCKARKCKQLFFCGTRRLKRSGK